MHIGIACDEVLKVHDATVAGVELTERLSGTLRELSKQESSNAEALNPEWELSFESISTLYARNSLSEEAY